MRKNLNILVSELGPTQLNYFLISNVNLVHENRTDVNIQVFTENLSRFCIKPHFGLMNVAEAWGQSGPFIATNLSTASKLIHYPVASPKIFYIWDLEWIRGSYRLYDAYAPIYLNKELKLVARSKEHADLISVAFNREVSDLNEDFNVEQFMEMVK